jgi:hypothetical protein
VIPNTPSSDSQCIGNHCRHPLVLVKNRASAVKGFLWFFLDFP